MGKEIFDHYAHQYNKVMRENLGRYGANISYYAEHKAVIIKRKKIKPPNKILDFGCGVGRNIYFLQKYFPKAEIWGCDVSQESIKISSKAYPIANFFILNNSEIEQKKKTFDLILIAGVLHHIEIEDRSGIFDKIRRLLRKSGELFIFEHNPYNPFTRQVVKKIPWDKGAILLKPKEITKLLLDSRFDILCMKYIFFLPSSLKFLQPIESILSIFPIGAQYFFHAEKY